MSAANRVKVEVLGASYYITTGENQDYIKGIEKTINEMLTDLMEKHPAISLNDALVLTCLNLQDSCNKSEIAADNIRAQLSDYLQEAARARIELDEANREIERLGKELTLLKR